tara:strand:+ start:427 stop:1224 length:798 start_codon:yes stop_codon:yes gene_type:complete
MIEDIPQSDETPEDIPVGDVSGETGDVPESGDSLTDPAGEEMPEIAEVQEEAGSDEGAGSGGDDPLPEIAEVSEEAEASGPGRRSFLSQLLAGTIGAVVGLVPVLSGLIFFLDPLFRRGQSSRSDGSGVASKKDSEGFIKLPVTRALLPKDGTPQQVTVEDDLVDAWNKFPNVPIGSVWVRVNKSGDVIVFNTICPHLGCSVEYRNVETDFYCPCHLSAFKLDGTKDNPIPPRDMDSLDVKPDTGDEIWVQFKNFRGGISEKVEI